MIPFKEVPFRKRSRKRPGKFNGDISKGRSKGRERKRLNKFNGTQLGNKDTNELTIARGENVDHAITDSDCEATLPNCCDADAESAKLPTDKEKSKCNSGFN